MPCEPICTPSEVITVGTLETFTGSSRKQVLRMGDRGGVENVQ